MWREELAIYNHTMKYKLKVDKCTCFNLVCVCVCVSVCVCVCVCFGKGVTHTTERPRTEQFLPCGQELHKTRMIEEMGPAQIRDKRPHIPHSSS